VHTFRVVPTRLPYTTLAVLSVAHGAAASANKGPYAHLGNDIMKGFAAAAPADADVADVAKAIVNVVDMPFGKRPFRVHIDPAQGGAEIVNGVADRVRTEMYRNIGLSDLLTPVIS
jgi:hypothetical protein